MPLEFQIFKNYHELRYGLSEKSGGSMKLTGELQKDEAIIKNRETYFSKENISKERIVSAGLVHKNKVKIVNENHAGQKIQDTDGLITSATNLFLTLTVADCFPIYFYEPFSRVIGLAHAGWKSIVKGIISNIIRTMVKNCGAKADKILVGIGPGIQSCHFEIQKDVLENFKKYPFSIIKKEGGIFIDLSEIIFQQLKKSGLLLNHIEKSEECTHCLKEKYFSYRRDKPKTLEAMIAYIGLV